MKITVKGDPKEIAALVEALQERRVMEEVRVKADPKEIFNGVLAAMHDKPQGSGT